jgi:hypothetical protein
MMIGKEINLLENYPQSKRDVSGRLISKTEEDKRIAQKFGKEFFDGSRNHGYGGFTYNSKNIGTLKTETLYWILGVQKGLCCMI